MSDAATPTVLDTLRQRVADAPSPVALKDLTKGLKKPAKQSAAKFQKSLAGLLADDLQAGRVFQYASGPKGADRYWHKDEQHAIREAVLGAAATPLTVADLVKKAAAAVSKTDKGFAEGVVRDLIGEDQLFEHPPKKKNGQPLFGVGKAPPQLHPLEVGKAKKDFDKLVVAAQKLLASVSGLAASDLVTRLGTELGVEQAHGTQSTGDPTETPDADTHAHSAGVAAHPVIPSAALQERILKIVEGVPSMLLSDLRARGSTRGW